MLRKLDSTSPCLFRTGNATLSLKAGTRAVVADRIISFPVDAVVTMPALVAGTDYAVFITSDGNVVASSNFSAPAGYNAATVLKIGGFHYAAGGNAALAAGGDTTPQINPYSIWDVKFRPACLDPRGMTLVADAFWVDIYLCGTTPATNGTSKYGVTIADGSSPPKIPVMFGGTGATDYGAFKWWHANELAVSVGKALLDYADFCAAAYGVTEGTNFTGGVDPVTTQLDAPRTSRWGLMQATGNLLIWGRGQLLNPTTPTVAAWSNTAEARGQLYIYGAEGLKMPLFGGNWFLGVDAGSRCVAWSNAPSSSGDNVGARFRCDHLVLP